MSTHLARQQEQHRAELDRILAMSVPTPDMLRAAAERPGLAGGRAIAILMKHRKRKKADVPGARRWMFGGRGG